MTIAQNPWVQTLLGPVVASVVGAIVIVAITGRIDEQGRRIDAATAKVDTVSERLNQQIGTATAKVDAISARLDQRIDGIYASLNHISESVDQRLTARIDKLVDTQVQFAAELAKQNAQLEAISLRLNSLPAEKKTGQIDAMPPFAVPASLMQARMMGSNPIPIAVESRRGAARRKSQRSPPPRRQPASTHSSSCCRE